MTQAQLGAAFGISDKAVSGWERDKDIPEFAKLPVLRRTLRVTYAWLHEGDGPPPAADAPEVLLEDFPSAEREAAQAGIGVMMKMLERRAR
jgi:transcriptional regulator with XRE-family HTH domain